MKTFQRDFIRYVSMNILSMVGLSVYILADTYFISLGMGSEGITALNLALPVYNLISGISLLCGVGGASRFILYKTQGNAPGCHRAFSGALLMGLGSACVFMTVGLFWSAPLARAIGAAGPTFAMTEVYLRMILLFSPAFITNSILSVFVKNDGDPRLAMAGMLSGSLFNTVFDYVFIFPLGLGMFGAVLATVFSPLVGILILSTHFFRKRNHFSLHPTLVCGPSLLRIITNGVPSLVTELASGAVMLIFNLNLLRLGGRDAVAAYGVMVNLLLVIISVFNGIAQGAQPLFGRAYALRDSGALRAVFNYSLYVVGFFSSVFYLAAFIFPSPLTQLFNSEGNIRLHRLSVSGFPLFFSQCLFLGVNTILIMYFVSTERPVAGQALSLLKGFILLIPLTFLLSGLWGIPGVWVTQPLSELCVCLLGLVLLRKDHF